MASEILHLEGVSKRLGGREVLQQVELSVLEGEAVAVVGHNASGKTTLLNILSTLWAIDSGEARAFGLDLKRKARQVRARLGYVTHESQLYAELSVQENLEFAARLYGIRDRAGRIEELLRWFGMDSLRRAPVKDLSAGIRRRVSVLRALIHQPRLLLLDEPFTNLDPAGRRVVEEAVRAVAEVGSVVLTAPSLENVPPFLKKKVFLHRGRVVREDQTQLLTSV
ncbi:MAG: heme ABC exporter ATP-binding protein CcmA [Nitrospirae bacterium]|nr:heme ABC exporter ATP-binding protein CcmA [Nitrospirota bacterium]